MQSSPVPPPYRQSQFAPPLIASTSMGRDGKLAVQEFPQAVRTTIHVDSRDRDYAVFPSSNEFYVNLPEALKNVSSAVLVSAELPLTYYVFSAARGNASMTLVVDGTTKTVTVPDGNYTSATMAAALKTVLDAAFSQAFTVAFDPASMRCTIASGSSIITVVGSAAAKATEWGLAYYLGFAGGVDTTGTTSGVTGTRVANLNPENYLLLDIEELNGVSQSAIYALGGSGKRTFAKVPLNGDSYQYNFYDKTLTYVEIRPPLTKLDRLRVAVRYHDGTLVDLNGAEWSFSIEFSCTLTRGL